MEMLRMGEFVECGDALGTWARQLPHRVCKLDMGENSGTEKGIMPGPATITLNRHLGRKLRHDINC